MHGGILSSKGLDGELVGWLALLSGYINKVRKEGRTSFA
jgi:hypothetical protein